MAKAGNLQYRVLGARAVLLGYRKRIAKSKDVANLDVRMI
jgi:hypothetical protein